MFRNALSVAMACVLVSAAVGGVVFAQQKAGAKAEKAAPVAAEPAQVQTGSVGTLPPRGPANPPALRLFRHTTSQGVSCCASCVEIASDGSCKTWGQCSPGVTNCPNWTN